MEGACELTSSSEARVGHLQCEGRFLHCFVLQQCVVLIKTYLENDSFNCLNSSIAPHCDLIFAFRVALAKISQVIIFCWSKAMCIALRHCAVV